MADPAAVAQAAQSAAGAGAAPMQWMGLAGLAGLLSTNAFTQNVTGGAAAFGARLPGALIILAGGILGMRLLRWLVVHFSAAARLSPALRSMIASMIGFVGWIVTLASVLGSLGLTQISVALGGSIALVAMALATGLNSITQDLMAGIFLISDEDFQVGYRVQATGIEGVVEKLSVRKTKLRTDDGKLHVVPNRNVDNATYIIVKGNQPPAAQQPAPAQAAGPSPAAAPRRADPSAFAEEPAKRVG